MGCISRCLTMKGAVFRNGNSGENGMVPDSGFLLKKRKGLADKKKVPQKAVLSE